MYALQQSKKAIHPKSRKAKQLSKKISRVIKLKKRRGESNIKLQFLGDKLAWFKDNMDEQLDMFTPNDVLELIQRYIDRNLEEFEQITMKNKIGDRSSRQHASREDHIRFTREREMDQFTSCGFETVDFLNPENMKTFKSWSGEIRKLQNLKLRKFIKQQLEDGDIAASGELSNIEGEDDDMTGQDDDNGVGDDNDDDMENEDDVS